MIVMVIFTNWRIQGLKITAFQEFPEPKKIYIYSLPNCGAAPHGSHQSIPSEKRERSSCLEAENPGGKWSLGHRQISDGKDSRKPWHRERSLGLGSIGPGKGGQVKSFSTILTVICV